MSLFSELPEENQRVRILTDIWRRCNPLVNCNAFPDFVVRILDQAIPVPGASPSMPVAIRIQKSIILIPEFREPVLYKSQFEKVSPAGSQDPNMPLLEKADEFFAGCNAVGKEILAHCMEMQVKLGAGISGKDFDNQAGTIQPEYVSLPRLTLFVVEKQLGVNNGGLLDCAYNIGTQAFEGLQITNGALIVWCGIPGIRQDRRKFIDEMIESEAERIAKFKEALANIHAKARELSHEFSLLREKVEIASNQIQLEAHWAPVAPRDMKIEPTEDEQETDDEESEFKLPKIEEWKELKVKVLEAEIVQIEVKGQTMKAHYTDLLFLDRKSFKPNFYWRLLIGPLAQADGKFTTKDIADFAGGESPPLRTPPRQILYKLRGHLKKAFKLDETPFFNQAEMGGDDFQTKFTIRSRP